MKDTPKSRRPHGRGSRRIYRGKALFHAEDEETMQVVRTEKSGNIFRNANWTEDELRHLTSFLMLHTDGKSWVSHKDYKFWDSAGEFIQQLLLTSHCRSGKKKDKTVSIIFCQCTWNPNKMMYVNMYNYKQYNNY